MGAEKGPSLKPSEKGSPYQCGLVSSLLILTLAADLFRPKEHVLQMEQLKWKCKRPSISSQKMSKTTSKNIKHMPANCKFCIFWQKRCYEYCMHWQFRHIGTSTWWTCFRTSTTRSVTCNTFTLCKPPWCHSMCLFHLKCPKNWTCRIPKPRRIQRLHGDTWLCPTGSWWVQQIFLWTNRSCPGLLAAFAFAPAQFWCVQWPFPKTLQWG